MTFSIDSTLKHSYSNDDTCFSIDVINDKLEEYFDDLLNEGSKILYSIEGTPLEEKLFSEFNEFLAMNIEGNSEPESDKEEPPFKKITFDTDYKTKTSLEEPPSDLELKPLLEHLEYVFLEEPTFVPVIISYANLSLNWEKCHFMVKEGIVLEHKVSNAGLKVDKANIDVISKLPPHTNVKGIRSFLRHAGFYRRFIKDFSKIARPLTKLLEKDTPFEFNDECDEAFNSLKEKLTCALVIVSPNWNLPFELICDASEFVVGAVLGKKMTSEDSDVDDNFLGETLMEIPSETYHGSQTLLWRCVSGPETHTILDQCHNGPTDEHYGPNTTAKKLLDSGFYWPTIIKEAYTLVRLCEACQKTKNISKRDEMPLNNNQVCKVFDLYGVLTLWDHS
nr:reverse transcriptase domain-containing protein [Tanacetum cinerariifolium]